jgi:hypothetical protein
VSFNSAGGGAAEHRRPDPGATSPLLVAGARPATDPGTASGTDLGTDTAQGTPVARLLGEHGALRHDRELRSLAAAWLASLKSDHTRDAYARDLEEWLGWLHSNGVDPWRPTRGDGDVYRIHLEALRFKRKGKQVRLGPASARRKMSVVSSFYTYLEDVDEDGAVRSQRRPCSAGGQARAGAPMNRLPDDDPWSTGHTRRRWIPRTDLIFAGRPRSREGHPLAAPRVQGPASYHPRTWSR